MSILARLCLLAAVAVTGLSAADVQQVQPRSDQIVPHDHQIVVQGQVPVNKGLVSLANSRARIKINNGTVNTSTGLWVGGDVGGVASTIGVIVNPSSWEPGITSTPVSVEVTFDVDTDGVNGYEHTGTITFQTKVYSNSEQPFRRFVLPPLLGTDFVDISHGAVRRIDSANVAVVGSSVVSSGSSPRAAIWNFNGTVVQAVNVHTELQSALLELGLSSVTYSEALALNNNGDSTGICVGPQSADAVIATVAWHRAANGAIHKLGLMAVGAAHVTEGPGLKSITNDGWVWSDRLAAGQGPVDTGALYGNVPPYRAVAWRWNGTTLETFDIHAELAVVLGVSQTAFLSFAQFNREGTSGALGLMTGEVFTGGQMRPFVRTPGSPATYVISASNQGIGDSLSGFRVNSAGDRLVINKQDGASDTDTPYLGVWDATGLTSTVATVPNFFGALTADYSYRSAVEISISAMDMLMRTNTGNGGYRSYILPVTAYDTTPVFAAPLIPEWHVPVGQLKSLDNVSYNSFEVTGHDGIINEDRVYIENVNKEMVNTKEAILLVHKDRIVTAASLTTASFAWPAAGAQLPAGHQFPTGIAFPDLPNGASVTSVAYTMTLPSGVQNRAVNTAWGPSWRTDFVAGATTGAASASALITYGDGSTDTANVAFTIVAAQTPQFGLVKLPRPVGYGEGRVEGLSTNGLFAAGYCEDGNPQRAALWSGLNGTPAVTLIDPIATIPGTVRSWAICVNNSGDVVGFSLVNERKEDVDNDSILDVGEDSVIADGKLNHLFDVHAWVRRSGTIYSLGVIKTNHDDLDDDSETFDWFAFSNTGVVVGQKAGAGDRSLPFKWTWNGTSAFTEASLLSDIQAGTAASPALDGASAEAISPDGLVYGGGYGWQTPGSSFPAYVQRASGDWDIVGLPSAVGDGFWVTGITNAGWMSIEGEDAGGTNRSFVSLGGAPTEILPLHVGGSVQVGEINDLGTVVGEQKYGWSGGWDLGSACIKTAAGSLAPLTWLVSPAELDAGAGSVGDQWHVSLWWAAGISDGANAVVAANGDDGPYLLRGGNQPPTAVITGVGSGMVGDTLNWTVAVADDSTAATSITLVAQASSDPTRIPLGNVVVGGSGASRTVAVTILSGAPADTVDITLRAGDGTATRDVTKTVTVGVAPPSAGIAETNNVHEDSDPSGSITVTLSAPAPVGGVTVSYAVSGSAVSGTDFNALSGSLVIAEGATSAPIFVNLINDSNPEEAETIVLTLQAGAGYTVGAPTVATTTIPRSDVNHWVFWIAKRHINDQPTAATNLVWWMTTVRPVASAVFKIPGKADIQADIRDGGTTIEFPHDTVFGGGDISLADLDAYLPVSPTYNTLDYQCVITYQDTTTETRRGSYLGFDPAGAWPTLPVFTAPTHGGTTALSANRMTVSWSNPINWVGISPQNGRSTPREYWESPNAPTSPYVLPIDLADDQSYLVELKSPGDHSLGRSDNPEYGGEYDVSLASMNSLLVQTGSTPAIRSYDSGSADLTGTIFGAMPDGAASGIENRDSVNHVLTTTISTELITIPGTATQIQTKKLHRAWNDGTYEQTLWLAKNTAGEVHVVKAAYRQGPLMTVAARMGEMMLLTPADPGTPWYFGTDGAATRTSTNATAPNNTATGCQQLTVDWGDDEDVIYIKPGSGIVEWRYTENATPVGGWYINPPGGNTPPVITEGAAANLAATEDAGGVTLTLNGTDDGSAAALLWSITSNGSKGVAGFSLGSGSSTTLTYTPNGNAFGSDSVTVRLTDSDGAIDSIVITVTIAAVNDAPSFSAGSPLITVNEDSGTYGPTVWATAISSGPLETDPLVFAVSNNNNGLFSAQPAISAAGALTFTPAANVNGSATVTVSLSDGALSTAPVNFTITVTAINDAPTATLAVVSAVNEDAGVQNITSLVALIQPGGGGDETSQTVTTALFSNDNPSLFSALPTLVPNNSDYDLTYTPAPNKYGSAIVTVRLTDSGSATTDLQFTITVNAVNDAPVATAVPTITGAQSIGATLTATSGTWNDVIDQVSPVFTYAYQWQRAIDNVGTGAADIGGATASTYVLTGADTWVRVRVIATDNGLPLPGLAGAVSDSLWIRGVNAVPVITGNAPLVLLEDEVVPATRVLSATDVETSAASLIWSIQTQGAKGTALVTSPGASATVSYTPSANAFGSDTVVVACDDGEGGISTVSMSITITGVNDAPTFTLSSSSDTVLEDAAPRTITGLVTAPSAGAGGETGTLTLSLGTPSNTALFSAGPAIAQNGTLTYTVAANAQGSSTVAIVLTDDGGTANGGVNTSQQVFTITVTPVNDAPTFTLVAGPTVLEDAGAQSVSNVLANLSPGADPAESGQTAVLSSVTNDNNSLFSTQPVITAGTLTYAPAANANGSATVTVTVSDDGGTANGGVASSQQTFIITVTPVNDVPSFTKGANQSANADAGAVSVSNWATAISAGAANESAQMLTFAVTNDASGLFLVQPAVSSAGTLTFTPKPGQSGSATINVTLADNGSPVQTSAAQTATITVTQGPVITDQPDDQLIVGGTAASLSVAASGLPTPTYQWQVFTSSWNNVGGETSPLFAPTLTVQTQYRCVVTNSAGSATSNVATISVGTVPVISDEADATSVPIGGTATFSVVASGSPAPTYQWQRSTTIGGPTFVAITNATGSSYSFGPVAMTDSGFLYRCVVTNALGSDTSAEPALTVTAIAPTFAQQPQPRSVVAGSTATFAVVVNGNPVPTLQWERSDDAGSTWSAITLATGPSFTTAATDVGTDDNDRYRCIATNSGGSATSSEVALSVQAAAIAPIVTPVSSTVSVPAGQLATLAVTATGSPTPTLQWRRNGAIIGGATGSSLSFTAALADSGASFTCTASNVAGSSPSAVITLTVTPVAPELTISGATTVDLGGSVTLTASVTTGAPAPGLQWQMGGAPIVGATSSTYVWSPVLADAGLTRTFTCVATNAASPSGVISNALGIAVQGQAPAFTQHPAIVSTATNGWATFTVAATGTPPPSFQWQTSADAGSTWTPVSGGTAASVTVQAPGTVPGTMPQYRCVASNGVGAGSATSNVATFTVAATAPTITTQPVDLALADAAGGSFTVVASSGGTLTYQWQRRLHGESAWSVVSGAIANSLPVTADLLVNQGAGYRCIVTAGGVSVATRVALLSITSAPQFVLHPVAHTAAIGEVATFTAEAVGGPQPTLSWERSPNGSTGWVAIPGATGNHLAFTVKATDIGMYVRCAASSTFGGGTIIVGLAVPLTVTTVSPSFTTQPMGSTIALGGQALLAVTVAGSPTPTVQWQTSPDGVTFSNVASNGTALTYTTPVAGAAGSTAYRCLATNAAGMVASVSALVQVQIIAPFIVQQPVAVSTVPTATATFAVVAGGSATLTYQWQKRESGASSFIDVLGATVASHTTAATSIAVDHGDDYRCVITNGAGSSASELAMLSVQVAPVAPGFTTHPVSISVITGQPVSFSVIATGVPTPTLQWRKGTVAIPGATFPTLLIEAADYADNGAVITCVATSSAGTATSNVATLTVTPIAPSITTHPLGVSAGAGSELSLSVVATGTGPLTYQWKREGIDVTGATTATHVIPRCSTSEAGMWTCVVTGPGGSVTSQGAQVAVVPVFFPVLTDLLDLDASPPEVVKPTPAAWGLADGELLKWVASTNAYAPVTAGEELTVGGSYFLDLGEMPVLLPRYASAPAPTSPPELDLELGTWNPASLVVADQINVNGIPLTFDQLAGIDTDLPDGAPNPLPTVWVVNPITGAMQMVGDPANVFGATPTAPAGSTLWIDTGAPSSAPGLRAPPMPKASG